MSFLDSPHVKQSMEETEFLRSRLAELSVLLSRSGGTDVEVALEYLHTVYGLVDKEHSLWDSISFVERHGSSYCSR